MKIGKIHVIYVYIKNQKQTDELPKSQVGYGLGEVCESDSTIALFGNDNDTGPWSRSPTYSFKSVGEPDYPSPIHLQSDATGIKCCILMPILCVYKWYTIAILSNTIAIVLTKYM